MKTNSLNFYHLLALVLGAIATTSAQAQTITPGKDNTGTKVNQNGNQFNIQGGTRSGANLFHSFDKFNLNSGQTANFLSTPDTHNILGRVTGGNASIINGLIQVIGGNSNLFLINPAGIMFGPNARLNIPASFSVTTATGIGFNNNNFWFEAMGTNNYANLVGNPSGYRFNLKNPGAIVNPGNLNLNPGENLSLLGGTVINTGQLSTAGGNITIAAVEGGSTLRISQPGHLLSLEVATLHGTSLQNGNDFSNLRALSLPELLTGGEKTHATSISVQPNGDIVLTNSNTIIADIPGDAIASGNIDVSTTPPLSKEGGYNIGGDINVLGDRVAIIDANINANGMNGGGTILIGGDFQGNGIVPNSQQTFVNHNSLISADAINNGNGGRVIIWSDGITNFAGNIRAKGGDNSGNGGFVEVSGKQQLIFNGNINVSAEIGESGTILFDPENIEIGDSEETEKLEDNSEIESIETRETETTDPFAQDENSNVTISAENIEDLSGEIILQADNDITVNEKIETESSVELKAGRSININADIDTSIGNGNISLFGNDNNANIENRSDGAASINQQSGTTLNAGSGTIGIRLGNLGEIGEINLANLTTEGRVIINANSGNITQVSPNNLITADTALFRTRGTGGIGLSSSPLRLDVNNLEAITGKGGAFINAISSLTIGGVNGELTGISTGGRAGRIRLNVDGDLTLKEGITAANNVRLNASQSVNINADINTEKGNENIIIRGNNQEVGENNSGEIANIIQAEGTNLEAGSGIIRIELGNSGEIGDINLANLTTNGRIVVDANGGNIDRISDDSLISAGSILFQTSGSGGIGFSDSPLRLDVEKIEALAGNGGAFFDVLGSVNIAGISTIKGGDIEVSADSKITVSGDISTAVNEGFAGNITVESTNGEIDTKKAAINSTSELGSGGDITLSAAKRILTGDVNSSTGESGTGGDIKLESQTASVNTTGGIVDASSIDGDGGNIEITAGRNIRTAEISAAAGEVVSTTNADGTTTFSANGGNGDGGNVTLTAEGNINTTGGEINTFSLEGDGGNVTISATGKIQTGKIRTASSFFLIDENDNGITVGSGTGDAGKITLESSASEIDTTTDNILSYSFDGSGGDVEITAAGDISTSNISTGTGEVNEIFNSDGTTDTESIGGSGTGGSITLNSGGVINTTAGSLTSTSSNNIGGDVSLSAKDDLQVGDIFTGFFQSSVRGGNITLESEGLINSPNSDLTSGAAFNGGDITITAKDDIQLGEIYSMSFRDGGAINITSDEGAISTTYISSASFFGNGGEISILAEGNIQSGYISSLSLGEGNGGDITIRSRSGSIDTSANDIIADSFGETNRGGDIFISADGDIKTAIVSVSGNEAGNLTIESNNGSIDTTNGILFANAEEGNGGNVSLTALGNISIADTTSSSDNGNGGNITIISSDGAVFTTGGSLISASFEAGKGGDIEVKANGNINSSAFLTSGVTEGGNINLTSFNGSVVISDLLSSSSENGIGGDITINSEGLMILSGVIDSTGNTQAGNINLTSNSSDVDTSGAFVTITSENGTDGNLNITANAGSIEIGEISGSRNIIIEDGGEDGGFSNNPDADITSDADQVNNKSGEVSLQAHNDITINEPIESQDISNLELRAGRNINLNADIDTSNSNGNISIHANDQGADLQYRDEGSGNITMAADTTINAGSGDISISIGNLAEVGDITLSNLLTTGNVEVDANGGNIFRSAENSLITAGNAVFQTKATGTIGIVAEPLNLSVENLEARSGSGGAFFNSPTQGINIGNASNTLVGISTLDGGEIEVTAQGDITVTESLFTAFFDAIAGDITLNSIEGGIDTTNATLNSSSNQGEGGSISLTATDNINTANLSTLSLAGDAGSISVTSLNGAINTTSGVIASDSGAGNAATVNLSAFGDINTGKIDSFSAQGNGGQITMNSSNGSINTNGVLNSRSSSGNGADIILNAEEDIEISEIQTFSVSGNGGNIEINSNSGIINTNGNLLRTFSAIDREQGNGGNVSLTADGDIYTGKILTGTDGAGVGGDISITSRNGSIDTTVDTVALGISSEADVTSEDVTTVFSEGNSVNNPNLHSYSLEGKGGDVTLTAKGDITTYEISSFGGNTSGDVNISSTEGNINTNVIFSTGENELGGNVFIQTNNEGNININHIATYSTNGTGGEITLDSGGNVTINNVASFGPQQSGDVRISSNISEIQTRNITTQAEDGPSGDIVVNGTDVATGNVRSLGSVSAGIIQIEATDGSIRTEDIESTSDGGTAGGIDLDATDDIETGSQTVNAGEGDANIENTAGDDISATEQIATANEGDANIDVDAGGNVNIERQTASTNEGDASIDVNALADIILGDQNAITQTGDPTITNTAGNNIDVENQNAITQIGDPTITNTAGNNIDVENQNAITDDGISTIENNAPNININNTTQIGDNILPDNNPVNSTPNNSTLPENQNSIPIFNNQNPENNPQNNPENNPQIITSNPSELVTVNPTTLINTLPTIPIINNNQTSIITNTPSSTTINPENNNNNNTSVNEQQITNTIDNPPTINTIDIISNPNNSNNNNSDNFVNNSETVSQIDSQLDNHNNPTQDDGQENYPTVTNTTRQNQILLRNNNPLTIATNDVPEIISLLERNRIDEFSNYFGEKLDNKLMSTENVRELLATMHNQTGEKPAVIYFYAYKNQLQLVLFTQTGEPILKTIPGVSRKKLRETAIMFYSEITDKKRRNTTTYLPWAQKLYQLLIEPISAELEAANIDTILFSMDSGFRLFPLAALYDGEKFLIEKYSISSIPSISLMDSRYNSIQNTTFLGMGASEFTDQPPLPAVPIELQTISNKLWQGNIFLNEEFTRNNLTNELQKGLYPIVHLATHAEFRSGNASDSYIQLWNDKLRLDELRKLRWNSETAELLVLSACRTAVGDSNAELGFAGLAIATGVKSALGSLWFVDDWATFGLMVEFYSHLGNVPIKAEALRQTQLAMIKGDVRIESGMLKTSSSRGEVALSSQINDIKNKDFSHPYYWAGFTMIGSPW